MASRRRPLQIILAILALFLLGTVVVLSSISIYLSIDTAAYLTEVEVGPVDGDATWNATALGEFERIPRIIHQTWKSETLPDRWKSVSQECRDMMPDYEYRLWTDADSREFIAKEYNWFLGTFDAYTYPIQRADAIRYFVLYHFGGVYLDLDVGCRRRLDRLLVHPVILPKTIPVGVSNDLMFSEKGHPFMAQTIHNLVTFDHSWVLNYPTVMFSTGPMFLSAQYGIWTSSHVPTLEMPGGEVRILPKALYGKNAKPGEAPHSFFSHFYGSSWHADDAAFIGFLGKWGKGLMWIGLFLLVAGLINLFWKKKSKRSEGAGRLGDYVLLPRTYQRNGRWHMDLGLFTLTSRGVSTNSYPPSTASSCPPSPTIDGEAVPMLPISFGVRPPSPSSSEASYERRTGIVGTLSRYSNRMITTLTNGRERSRGRTSRRDRQNRGYLFFLPAIFTPSAIAIPELGSRRPSPARSASVASLPGRTQYPPDKGGYVSDLEEANVYGASSSLQPGEGSAQVFSRPPTPGASSGGVPPLAPPPYASPASDASAAARRTRPMESTWDLWEPR